MPATTHHKPNTHPKVTQPLSAAAVTIRAGFFAFSGETEGLGTPGDSVRWMFGFPLDEDFDYGDKRLRIDSEVALPALEAQFGDGRERYLPNVKDNHEKGAPASGRLTRYVVVTREQLAARGIKMRYGRAVLLGAELLPHKRAQYDAGELRFSSPEIRLNYDDDQLKRALFVGECSFVDFPHFKGQPPLDELRGMTFSEYRAAEGGTVNEEQIKAMMAELEQLKAENARLKSELEAVKAGGAAAPGAAPGSTMQAREQARETPEAVILRAQEQRIRNLELDAAKTAVRLAFQEKNFQATDAEVLTFAELKVEDPKRYDAMMGMLRGNPSRPMGDRTAGSGGTKRDAGGQGDTLQFSELSPRERREACERYVAVNKLEGSDAYEKAFAALHGGAPVPPVPAA